MITGIEVFAESIKCQLSEFGAEFTNFRTSARRLELLPSYHVEGELSELASFLHGGSYDPNFNADWHKILESAKARGAKVERIRGLPEKATPYLRFEIVHAYPMNIARGESIKFTYLSDIEKTVSSGAVLPDFWLFDEARAYLVQYDGRGGFLGVLRVADAHAKHLAELYNTVHSQARPWKWGSGSYVQIHN